MRHLFILSQIALCFALFSTSAHAGNCNAEVAVQHRQIHGAVDIYSIKFVGEMPEGERALTLPDGGQVEFSVPGSNSRWGIYVVKHRVGQTNYSVAYVIGNRCQILDQAPVLYPR